MESWATSSGATFQAKKTYMIHFTRNKTRLKDINADTPLYIKNQVIHPSPEVKILGVILDAGLRYHSHIARACKRGTNAVLALRRLKNLRPEITRQLFISTVAPVIDYASIIWAPNTTKSSISKLDAIQRNAAQAVIGAFRTVSLHTAESEAGLWSVGRRFHSHELRTWVKWHSKPGNHRFWHIKKALDLTK